MRPQTEPTGAPPPRAFRWDADGNGTDWPPADRGTRGERPERPAVPQPRDYKPSARSRQSRGTGRKVAAGLVGLAVIVVLAGFGYKLLHHGNSGTSPTAGQSASSATGDPAQVVRAYFAAINEHRYLRAWMLVGGNSSGGTYQQFRAGFAGTLKDSVKILSTKGDVVTARLHALQDDGVIKTYEGTYTVTDGIITSSDVQPIP